LRRGVNEQGVDGLTGEREQNDERRKTDERRGRPRTFEEPEAELNHSDRISQENGDHALALIEGLPAYPIRAVMSSGRAARGGKPADANLAGGTFPWAGDCKCGRSSECAKRAASVRYKRAERRRVFENI
jgi:hypothetical protein